MYIYIYLYIYTCIYTSTLHISLSMSLLTPNLDLVWQKRPTPGDATTSIALYILQQLQKHWNNTATNATHTNRWCYVFYHTLFNATSATTTLQHDPTTHVRRWSYAFHRPLYTATTATTLQQHCNNTATTHYTLGDGARHSIALYTQQQLQ